MGEVLKTYCFLVVWHAKLSYCDQKIDTSVPIFSLLGASPYPWGHGFCQQTRTFHSRNLAEHEIFALNNMKLWPEKKMKFWPGATKCPIAFGGHFPGIPTRA